MASRNHPHKARKGYGERGAGNAPVSISLKVSHKTWLWVTWVIAVLYLLFMTVLAFRYHRTGGFGVETDFYAELAFQARKFLSGEFSPLNYGSKGPVYSFILAGVYLIVREYFHAGLIINLVSSFVFIVALSYLIRSAFNPLTAILTLCAVVSNYVFQSYTYQAGADMPFMAFCVLSIYFLFKSAGSRDLCLSALFGTLAFLTRYNGVFVPLGAFFYLACSTGAIKERLRRIALWSGVFIICGLPWFIPNCLATGNPVHNDNYLNVMLEFYASGANVSYERWTDALPKKFTSLGEIIMYDPGHFIRHMGVNVVRHFWMDMTRLIGFRLGVFVILGFVLCAALKPDRRKMLYSMFGGIYFLILTLVFYNERFSLFLVTLYFPAAVWPLTEERVVLRLKRLSRLPAIIMLFLVATYTFTSTKRMLADITKPLPVLECLKFLGKALGELETDKSQKIAARKPNVAHYAELTPIMLPSDVDTVDDLVGFCKRERIRYVLYSEMEYGFRPNLRMLVMPGFSHPGIEKVIMNMGGIVFRVKGI